MNLLTNYHSHCEFCDGHAPMADFVEEAVAEAKKALDGTDVDAIRAAGDKLQEVGHKLAEVVYSATQDETAGGQAGAGAQGGSDDVVDADYEVVDDDK